MPAPIITLTTDFGLRDGYVAAMKGVVLGIRPGARIVDITHDVPAQDIHHGAFVLGSAFRYFPDGTIHVAVIDPGVGTSRRPLLLTTPAGAFVGPDNGVFTYVLHGLVQRARTVGTEAAGLFQPAPVPVPQDCVAWVLDQPKYWRHPVSNTFHGRDIFAPVAAHLASSVRPQDLGTPTDRLTSLNVPVPVREGNAILGHVVFVDRFGNLITNIPANDEFHDVAHVEVCARIIYGLSDSYQEGSELLAIVGSHGYLEIAVRNGSASEALGAKAGSPVRVELS